MKTGTPRVLRQSALQEDVEAAAGGHSSDPGGHQLSPRLHHPPMNLRVRMLQDGVPTGPFPPGETGPERGRSGDWLLFPSRASSCISPRGTLPSSQQRTADGGLGASGAFMSRPLSHEEADDQIPRAGQGARRQGVGGPWVVTWSMWSQPAPKEESTVVSDTGEQWSPKQPPADPPAPMVPRTSGFSAPAGEAEGHWEHEGG